MYDNGWGYDNLSYPVLANRSAWNRGNLRAMAQKRQKKSELFVNVKNKP
jgi:hypothetical protein